ncbi:hypothetical protein C0Q70_10819 [Pomacea canaliculata]|uniref:Uncharacterized protein n=1 Tax=Pomacea canaliculata TaxID=400727 RepID=A0A2T7P480_POMCA|nr:hypothetical protein C0Q70_10819 [Pomacea canaliculata]
MAVTDRDLSEAVPLDDNHVDYAVHDAQAANAILQPEILEFDRNDYIDLAQARADKPVSKMHAANFRNKTFSGLLQKGFAAVSSVRAWLTYLEQC